MSDKEASVRLTLKGDGFKRGMSDAEADAKKKAKSIGDALKSGLSEAGKAGLENFKQTFGKIKDVAMGFVGVAGGLGFAEMARKALENESAFRRMAFQIKSGKGELVQWRDLQKEAQAAALKTGHTTGELAKTMEDLRDVTGDTTFARKGAATVAEAATGAHESIETMTKLAGGLNEKFGITQDQLGDTLATVVDLGNSGGVTVEELSENINRMGAGAKQAGLDGKEGFTKMVEWLHVAHESTGNLRKGISGVSGIIDGLSSGSLRLPVLQHAMYDIEAAKKSGKDFNTIIGDIIAKTGGKQENLAKIFSGDQLKVVSELGKKYSAAFKETSGDVKAKTDAGLKAYNAALTESGKATSSFKDLQEEAAKEMETPEKKIATALEKLSQLVASPKMMAAFESLANLMPKIVDAISAHPLVTGALLSGIPQAIAGSVTQGLISALMGKNGAGAVGSAAPIAAAATTAYLVGRELIDEHYQAKSSQENQAMGQEIDARNVLSASRTMSGSKNRADALASAQSHLTELQNRQNLVAEYDALRNMSNSAAGFSSYEGGARAGRRRMNQIEDRGDFDQIKMDLTGQNSLSEQISNTRQAVANLADKNYGNSQAEIMSSVAGGQTEPELFGPATGKKQKRRAMHYTSGLGSIYQEDRDAAATAQATAKNAQTDQAANQARLLADAITGRELKVRVLNADEIGAAANKSTAPAPGLVPR